MNNTPEPTNLREQTRTEELKRWLFDARGISSPLIPVSADASFRRYFRVSVENINTIVMDAPPLHNKNEEFIELASRLRQASIITPVILEADLEQGFILMEDLGDTQYLGALNSENADELYTAAITTLGQIQNNLHSRELPAFDSEFLTFEMRLLSEWYFTQYRDLTLNEEQTSVLESVFALCTESALEQPSCFVHRDYHSRNLMLNDTGLPGVLDFQDAVIGPLTYDIASLLRDCYISWPDDFVYAKLEQHRLLSIRNGLTQADSAQYQRWFDLMALQRHIKVMGIFCRLNLRDGKSHYMQDLPMVYRYIEKTCTKYPELSAFHQLLKDTGTEEALL